MVKLYIMSNPDWFLTDNSKIYFALSYMKGDNAMDWLADLFMDENGVSVLWTWALFVGKLKKQFMPATLKLQAKSDLQILKQDKGSVKDFFTKLDMLAIQAGYMMRDHISAAFINAIIWDGINNKTTEFIEQSQPALLDNYNNEKWKLAETTLTEINRCKETKPKWFSPYTFSQNMTKPANAALNYQPCLQIAKKRESVSSGSMETKEITYGDQGQPMDLSRPQ